MRSTPLLLSTLLMIPMAGSLLAAEPPRGPVEIPVLYAAAGPTPASSAARRYRSSA